MIATENKSSTAFEIEIISLAWETSSRPTGVRSDACLRSLNEVLETLMLEPILATCFDNVRNDFLDDFISGVNKIILTVTKDDPSLTWKFYGG